MTPRLPAITILALAFAAGVTGCNSKQTNTRPAPTVAASCSASSEHPKRLTINHRWAPGDRLSYRITRWRSEGVVPESPPMKFSSIADMEVLRRDGDGFLFESKRRQSDAVMPGATDVTDAEIRKAEELLGPLMLADATFKTDTDGQIVKYVNEKEITQAVEETFRRLDEESGQSGEKDSYSSLMYSMLSGESFARHATAPFDTLHSLYGIELDSDASLRGPEEVEFDGVSIPGRISIRLSVPNASRSCATVTVRSSLNGEKTMAAIMKRISRVNPDVASQLPKAQIREVSRYKYDVPRRLIVSVQHRRYTLVGDTSVGRPRAGTIALDAELLR